MFQAGRLIFPFRFLKSRVCLDARRYTSHMGSLPAERRLSVDSVCIIGAGPSGLAAAKYSPHSNTRAADQN